MDVALSSVALVSLGPLFAAISLAVRRDSPGPVLFRQVRIGSEGKPFEMLKFRTMVADADERKAEVAHLNKHRVEGGDPRMFKVPDDPRITRTGRFLSGTRATRAGRRCGAPTRDSANVRPTVACPCELVKPRAAAGRPPIGPFTGWSRRTSLAVVTPGVR